jgi:hypothetical protein
MASITREEILEYKRRWEAVAEFEQAEQRHMPIEVRWRQMNSLLCLARSLDTLPTESIAELVEAQNNWIKLRRAWSEQSGND